MNLIETSHMQRSVGPADAEQASENPSYMYLTRRLNIGVAPL
jgi:hypothetical protein